MTFLISFFGSPPRGLCTVWTNIFITGTWKFFPPKLYIIKVEIHNEISYNVCTRVVDVKPRLEIYRLRKAN